MKPKLFSLTYQERRTIVYALAAYKEGRRKQLLEHGIPASEVALELAHIDHTRDFLLQGQRTTESSSVQVQEPVT